MNQDVLLFAFANNHAKPLPTLQKEYEELNQILEDRNYNSNFHTTMFPFASVDDFTENIIKYRKKLFLFHFAGHAGPQKLEYLDINAHVRGISYLLSQCPNLKLVFLNGCSTIGHVNTLLESGIPVIIATSALVEDELATKFSIKFYKALENGDTINEAYELAKGVVLQEEERSFKRGIILSSDEKNNEPIWGIFFKNEKESALNEKLPAGINEKYINTPYIWSHVDTARKYFKNWQEWERLYPKFKKFPFHSTKTLDDYIAEIRSTLTVGNSSIRVLGMAGIGKTRLVFEAFRLHEDNSIDPRIHYGLLYHDISHENWGLFLSYINDLLEENKEALIIVDNCPQQFHNRLKRELQGSQLKLLTISSLQEDIEDFKNGRLNTADPIFFLDPKDFNPIIGNILRSVDPSLSRETLERLEDFADGYPQMAMLLANDIAAEIPNIGILNDRELAERLLGIHKEDRETYPILMACSIFKRFGFYEELEGEVDFIGNSAAILGPNIQPGPRTRELIFQICEKYQSLGIFERQGRNLLLKPKPLALRLAAEWWRYCRPKRAIQVLKELSNSRSQLSEALCDQMKYLDSLKEAQEITKELCGESAPFGQAEVLNSNWGSRLFRSLVEVNPQATLDALVSVFGDYTTEQLLNVGPGRRNIIWSLEKLCFRRRLFDKGIYLMYAFAMAENERTSNNATAQFLQFFQVILSGTEANLKQRFKVIENVLNMPGKGSRNLAFFAMSTGLKATGFFRMGGAEKQGSGKELKDNEPSFEEILDYWKKIIDQLVIIACSEGQDAETAKSIIAKRTRELCYRGGANLILTAIEKVVDCLGEPKWEEALDNLKLTLKYEKSNLAIDNLEQVKKLIYILSPKDIPGKYKQIVIQASWGNSDELDFEGHVPFSEKKVDEFLEEMFPVWEDYFELYFLPAQHAGNYFGRSLAKKLQTEVGEEGIERFNSLATKFLSNHVDLLNIGLNVLQGFHLELKDEYVSSNFLRKVVSNPHTRQLTMQFASVIPLPVQSILDLFDFVNKDKLSIGSFLAFKHSAWFKELPVNQVLQICDEIGLYSTSGGWIALIILDGYCWNKPHRFEQCITVFRKLLMKKGLWSDKERRFSHNDEMAWQIAATKLLERNKKDIELVKHLAEEIALYIGNPKTSIFSSEQYFKSVLTILIRDHFPIIWSYIEKGLIGPGYSNWKNLLGSRLNAFNYTIGILFECGDLDQILKWCKESSTILPLRIAYMMPKFKSLEDPMELHPFTKSMIDEFGNLKGFLNEFEANLETYGSSGSTVPILKNRKELINKLKDHSHQEVRDWVNWYSVKIDEEIRIERNRDAEWR